MGHRRRARELALQFLYQIDATGEAVEPALFRFRAAFGVAKDAAEFFDHLVLGVTARRPELDALIEACSHNWRLARMSRVDRNILRLAAFELTSETPAKVVINEAVELAKAFGTDESGAFINGLLDALRKKLGRELEPVS
jgi:N utilization substance protein B